MTAAETKKRDAARAVKFVELAQKRATKAINAIRSISKLSNRSNYNFTDEQVNKIAEALRDEVVTMHEKFTTVEKTQSGGFVL